MRIFALLALSFVLSAGAAAAPVKLTDAQMDAISAGVAVAVTANAVATGDVALARTDTSTRARQHRGLGVAFGRGLAVAVGSESAATGVDLFGEGDIVRSWTRSFTYVTADDLIVSKTIGFVFAIEFQDRTPSVRSRRGHGWHGNRHRFAGRRSG